MGGGNGQKSKMACERNAEKNKASKGTYARPTTRSPPLRFLPSIDSSCFGRLLLDSLGSHLEANKKAMNN